MAKKVLRKFYAVAFFNGLVFSFFFATYAVFLRAAGLNLWQLNLVNAIFMFSMFILEIPTGVFADMVGRKRSFVFSCVILSVSFLAYYFATGFYWFVLAEIIGAIGMTFASGAFEAWMVDSVKARDRNYDMTHAFTRFTQIEQIGVILGVIIGGYAGKINLALPWLMSSIGLLLLGVYAERRMDESPVGQNDESSPEKPKLAVLIKESVVMFRDNGSIRKITGLAFCFSFACVAANMYWAIRLTEDLQVNQAHLGWIFSLFMIMMAFGSQAATKIANRIKNEIGAINLSFSLLAAGISGAAIGGSVGAVLPLLMVHQFARGVYRPIKQNYTNECIPSDKRATILSMQSMIEGLAAFLGLLVSGFIADHYGVRGAWLAAAGIISMPVIWYMLAKAKAEPFP